MPNASQTIMAKVRIGTSGWNYPHWTNGVFYPAGLKPAGWLGYVTRHFDTVELNNSFYRLPSEDAFKRGRRTVPNGFVFAVKASRFITHIKRLKDPTGPLDLFFSRSKHLEDRLGPVLFQLPTADEAGGIPARWVPQCIEVTRNDDRGHAIRNAKYLQGVLQN
jgi:uncharacterized protein YecE (DUF72 family)